MSTLRDLLLAGRTPTVVGFDDGPGEAEVPLAGVVCGGTRMEGLVWTTLPRDGRNATDVLLAAIEGKFQSQLHAVLTDGISFGGLNLIDLPRLHEALGVPVVSVMRRAPDLDAFLVALERAGLGDQRPLVTRAGPVHLVQGRTFQCVGATPDTVERLLERCTHRGHVPEALRLAHLIAGAVTTGTSGRRA